MTATRRTDLFGNPVSRTVGGDALVDVEAELRRETPGDNGAYLIYAGVGKEVWVPKSLVEYDPVHCIFAMPEWLAKDKGLI
jgi:hypothetical protein